MSEITEAIRRRKKAACPTQEWISALDAEDARELSDFAAEHPASSWEVAREFGFTASRSSWTHHFKGMCRCKSPN